MLPKKVCRKKSRHNKHIEDIIIYAINTKRTYSSQTSVHHVYKKPENKYYIVFSMLYTSNK